MDNIHKEMKLLEATMESNFNVIQVLINLGVSVDVKNYNKYNSRYRKMTPLMYAAKNGNLQCLELLINNGADVNTKDLYDVTAAHIAAERGHYECLKTLLDAGANCSVATKYAYNNKPYFMGTTPLHLAANNHEDCVIELIKYGADYNAIDARGLTPLYIAAESGSQKCVHALNKYACGPGILLSLPGFETGDTPLHFAVRRGMIDSVRELLQLGSDVNHRNRGGFSPLHECVASSVCEPDVSLKILKLLVLNGHNTDINLPDSHGLTPLHYVAFDAACILTRRPEMAVFLISYGADINIFNHEGSYLLEYEYNSHYSDLSIFNACINTLNVLPTPKDLKNDYFTAHSVPCDLIAFFQKWFAVSVGERTNSVVFQHDMQIVENVDPNKVKKQSWYGSVFSEPPSLLHMSRNVIRSSIGHKNLKSIKDLTLPKLLKSYLVFGAEMPSFKGERTV